MSLTENILLLWFGVICAVIIWLCFERDSMAKKINELEIEMSLPTMPERQHHMGYTLDQMKAYGQQCRDAALEDAATLCDKEGHIWGGAPASAFFNTAEQIRSLK